MPTVPLYRIRGGQMLEDSQLGLLAELIRAGVLPAAPLLEEDTVHIYLRRVSDAPTPYEQTGLQLKVETLHIVDCHDDTDLRVNGELMITGSWDRECLYYSCKKARKGLSRIQPLLLGSLLSHLSRATTMTWTVYTATQVLEDRELMFYEGDIRGHWQEIHNDVRPAGEQSAPRDVVMAAARDRGTTPGDLLRELGFHEALPAYKPSLCLSLERIEELTRDRVDRWAKIAYQAAQHLKVLKAGNDLLYRLTTEEDYHALHARGECFREPVLILGSNVELINEVFDETWQMAAQTKGFMPNILIRIADAEDARRAALMLEAIAQVPPILEWFEENLTDKETP